MERRRVLRAAGGCLSISFTGFAGCFGIRDGGSDDNGDGPELVTDANEFDDGSVDEDDATRHLIDAQESLDEAFTRIETGLEEFDGVLDGEENTMDTETVTSRVENSRESLEAVEESATVNQQRFIDAFYPLINAVEESSTVIRHIELATNSFLQLEAGFRGLQPEMVDQWFQEFSESVNDAVDQISTARDAFRDVSNDMLEGAEILAVERVDRLFIQLRDATRYLETMEDGFEELSPVVRILKNAVSSSEDGDLQGTQEQLENSIPILESAGDSFDVVVDDLRVPYRPDVQAIQCVTASAEDAVIYFSEGIDAVGENDDVLAGQRFMNALSVADSCSYDLFEDTFETVFNNVVEEAGLND